MSSSPSQATFGPLESNTTPVDNTHPSLFNLFESVQDQFLSQSAPKVLTWLVSYSDEEDSENSDDENMVVEEPQIKREETTEQEKENGNVVESKTQGE